MENTIATINNTQEDKTMEIKESMVADYKELLDEYEYEHDDSAVVKTIDKWFNNKEDLRSILSNSQYWDEKMQAVILKEKTIIRSFDKSGVYEFRDWVLKQINDDDCKKRVLAYTIDWIIGCYNEFKDNKIHVDYLKNRWDWVELPNIPKLCDGQKWSRWIGQLMKQWELNKITDVRTEIYQDANTGELHKREKDYGYNYHFALLGDSINPLEIKGKTFILSINLLDYLTMSFGHDWASCHTIDKDNRRRCRNHYDGQYSAGTLSYGLDNVTMIAYIVDEKNLAREDRNSHHHYGSDVPYWQRDKEHREVVAWDNDKLYFARVYPDGRDGGDEGIGAQFREIIQQIFAECLGVSNMWTTKKGNDQTSSYMRGNSGNCAYHDWDCCGDGAMSFLRRIDGVLNEEPIYIGTYPICPMCGQEHCNEDNICCNDCVGEYYGYCYSCGDGFSEDEEVYIEEADRSYCCVSCANRDGWYIDHYDNWIHEDDAVRCIDNGDYYPDNDDEVCYCCDDDEWHLREDCHYDDYDDEWYSPDCEGIEAADDSWFHDEETAKKAGYILCDDDDEWHHPAN